MKNYFIFGSGQFSELLRDLIIEEMNVKGNQIFFVTKNESSKKNFISEKNFFTLKAKKIVVFIGVGNIKKRLNILSKLKNKKYIFPNFISRSALVMKKCSLGRGNIILPNSTILSPSKITDFNIIGTNTNILHHCEISNNCLIGGGSIVGAGTKIEKNCFIGVGSTIASKNIKIGTNSFISSGSVLLNNLQSQSKVIGNPARKILKV